MPTVAELFKKLSYSEDCAVSKESVELFNMYKSTDHQDTVYQVDNVSGDCSLFDKLVTTVTESLTTIAECEELAGTAPRHITLKHIGDALDIAEYYRNFNYLHVGQKVFSQQNIFLGQRTSLFEFLLDLLAALQTCPTITLHVHASRKPTALVVCKDMVSLDSDKLDGNFKGELRSSTPYCTLFVTEQSDIESAADVLSGTPADNISLWKLRHVLIQESVLARFIKLVSSRTNFQFPEVLLRNESFVSEFNDGLANVQSMGLDCISNSSIPSSVRPTLVIGASRSHLDKADFMAPLISVNVFRTIKEGVAAFNSANGGSISIWSDGLAGAYEVAYSVSASTVWINCFAQFHQSVPFSFSPGGFNYGGDLGILDRFVKVRTSQVNSIDPDHKPHKINELCGTVISKLRAKYVNVAVNNRHHFECLSYPLNLDDFQLFAEEEKVYSQSLQFIFKPNVITQIGSEVGSNKLANCLFNQRKTTVFAFGESFAN